MKKFLRRITTRINYWTKVRGTLNKTVTAKVRGLTLTIAPTVYNPSFFKSGQFFAKYLASLDLKGKRVLETGTGSGFLSIVAAKAGAQVTSVDLNPAAVACAKMNAAQNGVAMDVRQSNWFEAVRNEKFDIIIFSGPYLKGKPRPPYGIAWYVGENNELILPLLEGCPDHLVSGGFVLCNLSSDSDVEWYKQQFATRFKNTQIVAQKNYYFEQFEILKATRE
jgi:HemK-related putative methylase